MYTYMYIHTYMCIYQLLPPRAPAGIEAPREDTPAVAVLYRDVYRYYY